MAVVTTHVWQAKPGRLAELVQKGGASMAIHRRLGVTASILQQATYAGDATNRLSYQMVFDSTVAQAEFAQRLGADPEWREFVRNVIDHPDAPGTNTSATISVDLRGIEPGPVPAKGSGGITGIWQVAPGCMQEATTAFGQSQKLAAQHNLHSRFLMAVAGGPAPRTIRTALYAASPVEMWKGLQSLAADREWQAFQNTMLGKDSPMTLLSESTWITLLD